MGKAIEALETMLDYNGSVHSQKGSYGNYSPSNIKTLIISQDGFCALLHLPSLSSRKILIKQGVGLSFNEDYMELQKTGRINSYKPTYKVVLGTEGGNHSRVYSAIEEIIYLSQSANNLPVVQDNFEMLEIGCINEGIKNEFKVKCKRLRRISVINMNFINLTKFLNSVYLQNSEMRGSSELLSVYLEKQFGQALMSVDFNTDDWYKQIRTGVAQYKTYSVEGRITSHFQEVCKREEMAIKRKAIEEMNKEKKKKATAENIKLVKVYELSYLAYKTMVQELEKNPNMLYDRGSSSDVFYFKPIPECGVDSKIVKVDASVDKPLKVVVQGTLSSCMLWLSRYYIDMLYAVMKAYPKAFKVLMNSLDDSELKIIQDASFASKVSEMEKVSGRQFGTWARSLRIPSLCCTICKVFTNIDSSKCNQDYWYHLGRKRGLGHGDSGSIR